MSNCGFSFAQQLHFEDEGAQCGLQGKKREDCPYDKETQSMEWNHWVYGCELAAGELEVIKSGFVEFCSTSSPEPLFKLTVEEAIKTGQWKPRWAKHPSMMGQSSE